MTNETELTCYGATCPACGSGEICTTDDFMRNLHIFRCRDCGEMYAFSDEDLFTLGFEQVIREWHGSYAHQKRLEVRDD